VSRPVGQSVRLPVGQSAGPPVGQSAGRPVRQSALDLAILLRKEMNETSARRMTRLKMRENMVYYAYT
jgi:hypothetical protein